MKNLIKKIIASHVRKVRISKMVIAASKKAENGALGFC